MRRLRLLAAALIVFLLALAAAGCGKVSEVREPDVFAGEGIKPAPDADRRAQSGTGTIRIAVVTHGAAASAFWAIVKNGVDAAARQMSVSVSYRSPDTFNVERMKAQIYEAVDSRPDGLIVSIPDPSIAPAIRRAERAGIPVVSINSGANLWRDLGVLAHVGPREPQAGFQVGKRMAAAGVKRALCVKQELRNNALDQRCAGFARGMRAGGATARNFVLDVTDRDVAAPKLEAELAATKADGVLTLSSDAAKTSLEAKKEGGRATAAKLATFDLSPEILEAVKDGRMLFAVDQQAYLQGYMPIVMLTQQARYGLFPSQGQTVSTGPNFVTKENAELALTTSARGIR
jgi:simple sugar transport system substrate-binding protein